MFHQRAERPEGKHIHQQMHHIGMNKSMRYKAVPFIMFEYGIRVKRQFIQ
jgi:hypothetical protein